MPPLSCYYKQREFLVFNVYKTASKGKTNVLIPRVVMERPSDLEIGDADGAETIYMWSVSFFGRP